MFKTKQALSSHMKHKHSAVSSSETSETSAGGNIASEVFRLFRQGVKPSEVVVRMNLPPEHVKQLWISYVELSEMSLPSSEINEIKEKLHELEEKIAELDDDIDSLYGSLESINSAACEYRWECPYCGEKGYVALRVKCGACGREMWWGWWKKK